MKIDTSNMFLGALMVVALILYYTIVYTFEAQVNSLIVYSLIGFFLVFTVGPTVRTYIIEPVADWVIDTFLGGWH